MELVDTESLVPQEHLLRKVDKAVDFRKLYEIEEPLYSEEDGRPSVDSVVLLKIVLLQHLDGIPSLRGTLRRTQTDIAYRWFLGYTLNEELPHFSTVSYNFRHRFTEETIKPFDDEDDPPKPTKKKRGNGNRVSLPCCFLPVRIFYALRPAWIFPRQAAFRQAVGMDAFSRPSPFVSVTRRWRWVWPAKTG